MRNFVFVWQNEKHEWMGEMCTWKNETVFFIPKIGQKTRWTERKKNTKQFEWFIQKKETKNKIFNENGDQQRLESKRIRSCMKIALRSFFLFGSWKFDWIHARDNNNKINSVLIDWDTLKRRMQWFGGAEYGECITNVHLARQKYIKVKGWTDRKRKSRQTKQTERERGEKNLLQNCIIARLSMTNTIKVWIQSNRIETFLCGFLLIFFVRHYSRCNDHITTILKINMCVRARVCSFVFVHCEFLWQF